VLWHGYCSFLPLIRVAALDIQDDNIGGGLDTEPYSLGGLADALTAVQYIEISAEESVEESAFARALRSDD
jgi:hypothetical protein